MHIVHVIFEAFGGPTALAEKTGNPQQTVSYWGTRTPPEIPPPQRLAVMMAAQSYNVWLPAAAMAYLQSRVRTPKEPASTPTQQAAA